MNRNILIACLLVMPYMTFAQFSLSNKVLNTSGPNASEGQGYTSMTNNATDANDTAFAWRIIEMTYPTQWTLSFCDPFYCNSDAKVNDSYNFNLGVGKNGLLKGDIFFNNVAGTGSAVIVVQSLKYANISDTFSINATAWVTSVKKTTKTQNTLTVYPNPAKDIISISVPSKNAVTIEIFNVLGSKVKVYQHEGGETAKIDVSELQKGIYFIRINENNTVLTKQFQKLN